MKTFITTLTAIAISCVGATVSAENIKFGNDSGEYANDWECDDPRFEGFGMASSLAASDIRKDATDCQRLMSLGEIYALDETKARAATQCSAINFGDDSSDYANDGECDDRRFFGPGVSSVVSKENMYRDAKDCRSQCDSGRLFVRRY